MPRPPLRYGLRPGSPIPPMARAAAVNRGPSGTHATGGGSRWPSCFSATSGKRNTAGAASQCGSRDAARLVAPAVAATGNRGASAAGAGDAFQRMDGAGVGCPVRSDGVAQHEVAVKLSRWIASAALGCLMIAAAYLPPEPREERYLLPSPTSTEEARLKLVSDARQRTEDLLAGLRFRDSVRTRLRANVARPAEAALVVTGSVPADRQQSIRRTMEQIWREAHGVDGSSLLLLLDVQPKLRRYTVEYVLPQALDQRTCVVAITIDPTMKWLWSTSVLSASDLPSALRESLGPCLYYAAFGEPGPHIARWLEERSYKLANSGNWTKPAEVARRSEDPAAWNVLVSNMSFNAVACLAGRADRCRPVVADVQQEEPLFRGASRGRAAR